MHEADVREGYLPFTRYQRPLAMKQLIPLTGDEVQAMKLVMISATVSCPLQSPEFKVLTTNEILQTSL